MSKVGGYDPCGTAVSRAINRYIDMMRITRSESKLVGNSLHQPLKVEVEESTGEERVKS